MGCVNDKHSVVTFNVMVVSKQARGCLTLQKRFNKLVFNLENLKAKIYKCGMVNPVANWNP